MARRPTRDERGHGSGFAGVLCRGKGLVRCPGQADGKRTAVCAQECLLKSISIWPGQSYAYFNLGRLYVRRQQLADARTAFRACLRNEPEEWVAGVARTAIAQINEEIGVETAPDTAPPDRKPQ